MSAEEEQEQASAVLGFGRMPADWGVEVSILGPGEEFGTRECFEGQPYVVWRMAVGDEVEKLESGSASPPGAAQKFEWHGSPDSALFDAMSDGGMGSAVSGSDGPPQEGVLVAAQVCVKEDGTLEGETWMGTHDEPDLFGGYTVDETFAYEITRVNQTPPDAPTIRETLSPLESVGGEPLSTEEASRMAREAEDDPDAEEQADAFQAAQQAAAQGGQQAAQESEEQEPDPQDVSEPEPAGESEDDADATTDVSVSEEARSKGSSVKGLIGNIENAGDVEIDVVQYTDARHGPGGPTTETREVDVSDFNIEDISDEIESEIDQAIENADSVDAEGTSVTETVADREGSPVGVDDSEFTRDEINDAATNFDTSSWNEFNSDCLSDPRYGPGECGKLWSTLKEQGLAGGSGNEDGGASGGTDEEEGMSALDVDWEHGQAVVAVQPDCPGCEMFLDDPDTQEAIETGDLLVIERDDPRWMDVMVAIGTDETPALGFYDEAMDELLDEEEAAGRGLLG